MYIHSLTLLWKYELYVGSFWFKILLFLRVIQCDELSDCSHIVFVYCLQFTAFTYQQTVEPQREATFEYSFIPNEAFSSRAFGLTVNLNYRDSVSTIHYLAF